MFGIFTIFTQENQESKGQHTKVTLFINFYVLLQVSKDSRLERGISPTCGHPDLETDEEDLAFLLTSLLSLPLPPPIQTSGSLPRKHRDV